MTSTNSLRAHGLGGDEGMTDKATLVGVILLVLACYYMLCLPVYLYSCLQENLYRNIAATYRVNYWDQQSLAMARTADTFASQERDCRNKMIPLGIVAYFWCEA